VNASQMRSAILAALRHQGLEQTNARSYARSAELIWVVWPQKARYSRWFSIDVGLLSRELTPDLMHPTYDECHFLCDYAFIGERVPEAAKGSRFDDHRSYFTMALTVDDERISDTQRREAVEFAAADLGTLTATVTSMQAFGPWRATQAPDSFLHVELRRLLTAGLLPGSR